MLMLTMVSMGAWAQIDVQIANDGKFDGGTIKYVDQTKPDEKGFVTVTITVTPNKEKGYTIKKGDISVYSTLSPSGPSAGTRALEIADNLTLYFKGSADADTDDLSAERDYTFNVPSGFGAWVKEASFQSSGKKEGDEPTRTTPPVEITTDANEDGIIDDTEKKLYLIQTNAFQSFYIAPQDNNTITTNNILGDYMLWYFLDAGKVTDNNVTTQYYYIVNNSTEKYIYNHNGNSRGILIISSTDFANLSDANKEKCKFKLVVNNNGGTTDFYNINVKADQTYYGLNKQNGSEANANPIRLTNTQYINDTNSKWKFIPFNGTFTYPAPPFTPSTDSEKHYYEIHNYQKDTYYAATDATPDKVIFTNQANESRAWYFKEASSDNWYKYYYIVNPATGDEYMYYNGTATNGSDQNNAVSVKTYDSNNEDRYQFVVVQAARGDGESRKECYAIIPKLLIGNLWSSNSIGYAQGSITNGLNMGIISSRGATNGAQWDFKTTTFTTVCANPVIAFDRTTGKASITTSTLLPIIYYTTDGTTPSSTNGTLYSGPFALTEQTTVKAIVTKEGYTDSEVTTSTIYKVATPTIQQETGTHNVSITTTTPGATIYYTTDGTTPTTSSTLYTGASEELGGKPIKAIAVKDGMINSDIGEGTVDVRCATPVISFNNVTSMVSITCGTEGSTIHYTIDNSEPTSTSTAYSGPFSVTSPTTVKAIATHATLNPSAVAELVISQVATPTIQNNGSNAISITTATVGATIYYTTDGSTPTTSSTEYTVPLTENISGVIIKAIAVKEGMITSAVVSNAVTLQCATPVIARSGNDGFTISCPFPASGVTIYYTTDGTTPTTSSSSMSPGDIVPCTLPVTVNAMAVAANYDNSDVSTATLKEGMDGDGTVGNPYTIKYQVDVEDFIDHVNTAEGASLHYKVIATAPLDFSSADPITQAFSGTFDGGAQPITGLTHPLFNTVDGGVVKNVTLQNVSISSSDEYVGAIAGIAQGYSRIYNCGILPNSSDFPEGTHPTVNGGTCAGGIVGKLDGDSRVINCYSYADVSASTYAAGIVGYNNFASTAEVSGGKYTNLKTAVVNCMFYGNITGGSNQYGVYGGELITNAAATGISSYNYYRNGSTFTTGEPTAYNCSFPADERYLTQVEFHRSLLNSNRELCGWWVGSDVAPSTLTTTEVQAIPKDASLMYKWVVDPNLAPYPILKPFGKYPSIINTNTGTPWFDRNTANPFEGKQLGTLSVIIKSGGSASDQHLNIPITDMDSLHYDFGYRKVQLPYYNTVFGNPDGATWQEKYAGNYTDQVVTGWKITNVSGGTQGSFVAHWQDGYNFADRKCTNKDLYSVSGRVFAQGGYYYVPDDVTEITIEAYWGKALYVRNNGGYYDRVNVTSGKTGDAFAPTGTRDNNVNGATIQTTSIKETLTAANIDAKKTVYDYALVLVGNVQESVGKSDVVHKTQDTRGFTIMSVDLDFDEEPDYCLEWQLGENMTRQVIAPIRFDFLPVVELGIAGKLHNSKDFYSLGCYRSKGHFEVTETAFIRFGQFEFELGTRDDGPIILNGGIYDQYSRGRNGETNQHINYVILGGHIVMPSFTPGAHVNSAAKYQTRHCAVNVLGGDFTSFYLTGGYNEAIVPYNDNPHCYIDGGRFGTIAAAYKEGIAGDVTWRINHALIGEFYGGGVMAQATGDTYKIVKGSIDVAIDNSIVGKYCGGPKFGDMVDGKTVTTSASNTVFNQFFGAGNGGTNYVQYANTDATGVPVTDWSSTINTNYTPGKYRNKDQGYAANYDLEVINYSTGDGNGKFVNRSYYYSAQFATTNTGNVTSTLTDCTINTNFYGGGFLGGVTGNVTSTLNNCTVKGAVFGAGYSASAGTVDIHNKDKVPPVPNTYTGMIKPQSGGTSTTYEWTNNMTFGTTTLSTGSPTILNPNGDGINYIYTQVSLENLGSVSGKVTLTIDGTTTVAESVYGGGEESSVGGNTEVNVTGGTITQNVFGGGKGEADHFECKKAMVGIDGDGTNNPDGGTTVNITAGTVKGNVYGGGEVGRVEKNTLVTIGTGEGSENNPRSPIIEGSVFGAGKGKNTHGYSALVRGNTTVTVQGDTWVKQSVYGGGEIASVGRYKVDETTGLPTVPDGGGKCTVTIQGYAEIGPNDMKMTAEGGPNDAGHVFGAGKGVLPYEGYDDSAQPQHMDGIKDANGNWEDNPKKYTAYNQIAANEVDEDYFKFIKTLALASDTEVTIGGHAFIKGSVYGGSENGFVQADTHVTIKEDCQIGNGDDVNRRYTTAEWAYDGSSNNTSLKECASWSYASPYSPYDKYADVYDAKGGAVIATDGHTFYGNVFAGGSGYYPYKPGRWFEHAGAVYGKTQVDINGGHILTSVYGGNEMTDVKGSCTVNMTGGTVGVPRTYEQMRAHPVTCYIFGAGKGDPRVFFNTWTNVGSTQVNISGLARIYGSTFGGGEDGHVLGDAETNINTGSDVPVGTGESATTLRYPYIGTTGTSAVDGNIFGGGRGYSENALTAGVVCGNVRVNIHDGTILGSIFGGGRLASVGTHLAAADTEYYGTMIPDGKQQVIGGEDVDDTSDNPVTHGHITITIDGGSIGAVDNAGKLVNSNYTIGDVFGGSKGSSTDKRFGFAKSTIVTISEPNAEIPTRINRSVFGGGEAGNVEGDVAVTLNGGIVGEDLYGGGALADTNIGNWNATLNEGAGGFAEGIVGEDGKTKYKTEVNLLGGTIKGDAFGGGLGQKTGFNGGTSDIEATTYGDITVTLGKENKSSATAFNITYENTGERDENNKPIQVVKSGRLFGTNNLNGSPKGNVTVNVYKTVAGNVTRTDITRNDKKEITSKAEPSTYEVAAVYGGGNLADYTTAGKKASVIIHTCDVSVQDVYGGGNAASVPETDVLVKGAYEIEHVFGGGNGKDKFKKGTTWMDNDGADVLGDANTLMIGGYIHEAYGGSNEKGKIHGSVHINADAKDLACDCVLELESFYTAGNNADVDGDAIAVVDCMPDKVTPEIYGGAKNANVKGNVELTIRGGTFGKVFGGNNQSGAIFGHIILNIEETNPECSPIIIDELYGCGNNAAYSVYGYYQDGTDANGYPNYVPRTSASDHVPVTFEGKPHTNPNAVVNKYQYDDPVLNIISCTRIGKVFGGGLGLGAVVYGNPTVNINQMKGVWAGQYYPKMVPDGNGGSVANTNSADLVPDQLGEIGDVFGGGNEAEVKGNTTVNIGTATTVQHHISYNKDTGVYTMSEDKVVLGANIIGNVYGGGNKANVTGSTKVNIGKQSTP